MLALFSERKLVEAQMLASRATYLPIASAKEHKVAKQLYRKALSVDDSPKRYLRTIHRTLKAAARA